MLDETGNPTAILVEIGDVDRLSTFPLEVRSTAAMSRFPCRSSLPGSDLGAHVTSEA